MWVMAEQLRHFGCPVILPSCFPACNQSWTEGKQADGMQSLPEANLHLAPLARNIFWYN